ncbi:hypothetical protein [Sphingosinicella soli]|uniref:Uncharacterized protein n=1 Tax=Sphingosinicella soli TaxID=333708 RepID=A0A7W7B4V3_9SPHN|nr:hypothetical protein [Sphingosinicella soli]MBB4632957.1 hypothetical protein [Sphingosinicella soli]
MRALFIALGLIAAPAAAQLDAPPEELYGRYAPGGDCSLQPRIEVGKPGVFIDTAAGRQGPLPVSVCYSCAGGARYEGIQRWVYVKYGKDKWGGDNMPVIFMFNAQEKRGLVHIEHDDTLKTPIGAQMTQVVRAKAMKQCGAASPQGAQAKPAAAKPVLPKPAPPAKTPADGFASVLGGLLRPATSPANSYYDWRHIESAPHVTWAALPPEMLDKPMSNGEYFRRAGIASVAGQQLKVLAGGARTMVMTFYFKNEGKPIGTPAMLAALKSAGYTATLARCPKLKTMPAPVWYRLSAPGKRPAYLWVTGARPPQQPWEGFSLSLDEALKPLTAREAAVYTDRCA